MSQESSSKHSLWLTMPDLQATVDALAQEVGDPTFVPHMTLIGEYIGTDDESMALARKVAELFNSRLSVDFSGFGTKHEAFRFFCFLAKPNGELARLYDCVYKFYRPAAQETFRSWPHASLLYGTKSAMTVFPDIDVLKARFGQSLDGLRTFSEVAVVETSGSVESWHLVGSVPLVVD